MSKLKYFTIFILYSYVCIISSFAEDKVIDEHSNSKANFTVDWFSMRIPQWDKYRAELYNKPNKRCLEIGSFEGRATIYIAENLCNGDSSYTDAIDTWNGSIEHQNSHLITNLYDRFTHNTKSHIQSGKIIPHRGESIYVLSKFIQEVKEGKREKYDLIYVDASHEAKDVLVDASLSWNLLRVGGIMVFDDYYFGDPKKPNMRPRPAIDGFLNSHVTLYVVMHHDWQVHIRKIKDSNDPSIESRGFLANAENFLSRVSKKLKSYSFIENLKKVYAKISAL